MKNIELVLKDITSLEDAEKEARNAVSEFGGHFSLLSWYDKARGTGAPQEVCSQENWKCPRDYAEHHEADVRVAVNGDAYEFYFIKVPADAETLEADEVGSIHADVPKQAFDNVQGG
ncbi:MAG: hypothetical protein C4520_12345 [Candidatus Abyssobacteria bacterium SURF_5]|uniref:DUF5619 domain-containing protein n=1 Tax=Abyssobacteria bacterium (strain SURF_5) TaxID=2093360 RepID=A0A3A4NMM8_ABYX5|nr:MAG: hypothetical protein C4520_12345 [Candidatus Abyssubacteria bacterium SURF_5]